MQNEANEESFDKPKTLLSLVDENRLLLVSIGILLFVLAFFLRIWRLSSTPDIFGDEVLYTSIAVTLPQYGHLVAFGSPWFVHPPLFYLLQSGFFQLSGINGVTLANIFTARLTSALYSALTVTFVFILIAKISDYRIGLVTALVLMVEPYALKYARIGILESLVILFIVVSIYLYGRANANSTRDLKLFVLGGVFFGLAMLTKELAIYLLVVVAVWLLLTRYVVKIKVNIKGTIVFLVTGLLMYLGYVVWALSVDASVFLSNYLSLIERALWIVRNTGYTSPNYPSFTSDLLGAADIYLMTYVVLALSVVSCVYLLYKDKSQSAVLMTSWLVGSAIFFSALGIHNPQFFVYLTVPAAVISGYALSKIAFGVSIPKRKLRISAGVMVLLSIIIFYNVGVWSVVDGAGTDNAFSQSVVWVQANIPNGQTIYVVSNYVYEYFLTDYHIRVSYSTQNIDSIRGDGIHYFILSKSLQWTLSSAISAYVLTNGKLAASFYGRSYQEIDIYYIATPV